MSQAEALEAAEDAGLRYVDEAMLCIRRRRRGKGWQYIGPEGESITDRQERARIDAIAVPPAWTDVRICNRPNGHILAVRRDAKGRKQYRYHPRWREVRDENKFERTGEFGVVLPEIRRATDKDMRRRGLPRQKVLAAVVRLLDETLIRVGNDEYAEENESYGLTTLRHDQVDVNGSKLTFDFTGKSGIDRQIGLCDSRLARIVHQCHELGGQELFAYRDGSGDVVDIGSVDVNLYLNDLTDDDFTAKDFRTWGATVEVARCLAGFGAPATAKEAERNILAAIDQAAGRLGNTRTVCRTSYVHPAVPEAYREGDLLGRWRTTRATSAMDRGERTVLAVLRSS